MLRIIVASMIFLSGCSLVSEEKIEKIEEVINNHATILEQYKALFIAITKVVEELQEKGLIDKPKNKEEEK